MCCNACCDNLEELDDLKTEVDNLQDELQDPLMAWLEDVRRGGINILEDFTVRYDAAEKTLRVSAPGSVIALGFPLEKE